MKIITDNYTIENCGSEPATVKITWVATDSIAKVFTTSEARDFCAQIAMVTEESVTQNVEAIKVARE